MIFYACDAVKRNAQGRRRDKHKKAEQDASQAADNEEPELPPVDKTETDVTTRLTRRHTDETDRDRAAARRRGDSTSRARGGAQTLAGRTTQEVPSRT